MNNHILEAMSQEQLEWLAHKLVLALRAGNDETKLKRAYKKQSIVLEQSLLVPIGKEIKRRKDNG